MKVKRNGDQKRYFLTPPNYLTFKVAGLPEVSGWLMGRHTMRCLKSDPWLLARCYEKSMNEVDELCHRSWFNELTRGLKHGACLLFQLTS